MLDLLQNVALSGAGVGLFLVVIAQFMPEKKIDAWGESHGQKLSKLGRGKLGFVWEKVEAFLQKSAGIYWAAFNRGLDGDDKEGAPAVDPEAGKSDGVGGVLPLILMALLLGAAVPAAASSEDPLAVDLGSLTLKLPLAHVDVVHLLDLADSGRYYIGAETHLAEWKSITGTFGAVTTLSGHGMPFLGAHTPIGAKVFDVPLTLGLWVGRDFKEKEIRGGVKASKALW